MNFILNLCYKKLWLIPSASLPFYFRIPLIVARACVLSFRNFINNGCLLKAASLTFYTLFSIVPVLAFLFGISNGLGLAQLLEERLKATLSSYPALADSIITFSMNTLRNTRGGILAGIGILLLAWSAIKLLTCIERNFNDIWGVARGRSFVRKITDYIAILLICPFMMLTSASILVFAKTHLDKMAEALPLDRSLLSVLSNFGQNLLPLCTVWIVFCFIYIVIPNTKVKFIPALFASLCAAFIYTQLQGFYITAQFTTARFNAIYGSFAAFPFFLLWLNLSWIVILGGAQLAFSIQNAREFEMLPIDGILTQSQKYIYAMEILALASKSFLNKQGAVSDENISRELMLPIRTTRKILHELYECRIMNPVIPSGKIDIGYWQIAVPPDELTPGKIISVLVGKGGYNTRTALEKQYMEVLEHIHDRMDFPPANIPVHTVLQEHDRK